MLQVNYKSDLNWIKGVGWTPPGSHKAELARRAAELGLAEGVSADEAIAKYQQMMMVRKLTQKSLLKMITLNVRSSFQLHRQQQMEQQMSEKVETTEQIHPGVNMDAMEVLQVKRNKTMQKVQKKSTTTTTTSFKSVEKKSSTSSSFALQSTVNTSMSSKAAAIEDE